jgi:LysR family transcriptional regulator of gallate degradation
MHSRRLRHFLAVYANRSLARAAEQLHVTQPALSKSIQQLEDELRVALFERSPLGMVPTRYADALQLHARVIEAEMQNAAREIAALAGASGGELTVGVTPSVAADLVPRAFATLQATRPGLRLNVTEGLMEHHVPALRRGELDLVVGGAVRDAAPDLAAEIVLTDAVRVYARAGHPLSRGARVLPEQLLGHPWVLPPRTQCWLAELDRAFVARGQPPPVPAAVTNSASFIRAMLLRGDYLSALPAQLLAADVRAGTLAALPVAGLTLGVDIVATYRARAVRLPAFDALLQALRGCGAVASAPQSACG